jgi:hypothetical protein
LKSAFYQGLSVLALPPQSHGIPVRVLWPCGDHQVVTATEGDAMSAVTAEMAAILWANEQWRLKAEAQERAEAVSAYMARRHALAKQAARSRARFPDAKAYDAWVYGQVAQGRKRKDVAAELGVTPAMVAVRIARHERWQAKAKAWQPKPANLGRPIDMGGKRGEWIEFTAEDQAREFAR